MSSFLLLFNIWTNKRLNMSLVEDVGRAETELGMVLHQVEYCSQVKKEKDLEILNHVKQKKEIENILIKSKKERNIVSDDLLDVAKNDHLF